ncbi:MAG: ornithine cyclodeaminase family protein [Gemmatimonadetes bacterium]|nr:ornithine cyclodeaminase family protein [Gemmatimonadota bacterium]
MASPRTLLIDAPTARALLPMADCVAAVEEGFLALAAGQVRVPLRTRIDAPELGGAAFFMPAGAVGSASALGQKVVTVFDRNRDHGLPSVLSLYVLLDPDTGAPACVMDGRYLTNLRTGAATGVAVRRLAPGEPLRVGILGLGVQALYQLLGVAAVRAIERIVAYSPAGAARQEWAGRVGRAVGTDVEIAASAEAAVRGASLVILATSHAGPVASGAWLEAGATVCAIGMHSSEPWRAELDPETLRRAERVVCDLVGAVTRESGDIIGAIRDGILRREALVELAGVVAGRADGRLGRDELIVFRSVGLAVEDLFAARMLYRRAREQGAGTEFAFDDFGEAG